VDRAIPTLEGTDDILDGDYWTRSDPIYKCYEVAEKLGFKVFALQAGGWCASSSTAEKIFNKYGMSSNCANDGEGGPNANQVYYIKGIQVTLQLKKMCSAYTCQWAAESGTQVAATIKIK